MVRFCSDEHCGRMIHDGDEIIILAKAYFKSIPSERAYAISQPTECYQIFHSYCKAIPEVEE